VDVRRPKSRRRRTISTSKEPLMPPKKRLVKREHWRGWPTPKHGGATLPLLKKKKLLKTVSPRNSRGERAPGEGTRRNPRVGVLN